MTERGTDYLNDWNGHDALIEGIAIDLAQKTVVVRLMAYPQVGARDRRAIEFAFTDVETVTTSANLDRIEANSSAGTVNHWRLADGPGASFFYLSDGYIAVTARAPFRLVERPAQTIHG